MSKGDLALLGIVLIFASLLIGGWLVFLSGVFLCVLSAFMSKK